MFSSTRSSPCALVYFLAFLTLFSRPAFSSITVYYAHGQTPLLHASATVSGAPSIFTPAVDDGKILAPPPVPDPLPDMSFDLALQSPGTGLSKPQNAGFVGLSIEMSVANQILGKNSTLIPVPFLNLIATLQQRSGQVNIRVGGNSQEAATLVDSLSDGRIMAKGPLISNMTATPSLLYTLDLLYLMRNISNLVNARWFLGVPFSDTTNFQLDIVEHGQAILGDYLLGLQVGNEPDLYPNHGLRSPQYGAQDYVGDFGKFVTAIVNNPAIKNTSMLMGPSVTGGAAFSEQDVWNAGFLDKYNANLAYLTVQHYQGNNCGRLFPSAANPVKDPQTVFPEFLRHDAGQNVIKPFLDTVQFAIQNGKQYIMLETNSASCGGYPGVSDSFGAALWGLDYAMQLAYSDFSGVMMHIGGQQAFYNPFTPPPTNQSSYHSWSIGPIFYTVMVMAEAMGPSNTSQILDLNANSENVYTPAYAIYENGVPARVALFNYIDDPSGASTYSASISVNGVVPSQVKVKYLEAPSVSAKYNFTWAGQTFGDVFGSDGRLSGTEDIKTVTCNDGACIIQVPAPGFALVFLSEAELTETAGASSTTFPTTVLTRTANTVGVAASLLATSNGHSGITHGEHDASTSKGAIKKSSGGRMTLDIRVLMISLGATLMYI